MPSCSHLLADPLRLRQVLLNLLGIAIKFIADNGDALEEFCQKRGPKQCTFGAAEECRDRATAISALRAEGSNNRFDTSYIAV